MILFLIYMCLAIFIYYDGVISLIEVVCNGAEKLQCWKTIMIPLFFIEVTEVFDFAAMLFW
ncbi:MAG: hypothetical protein EU533_00055 [Promethearchaeota archaeon]|nr:MAG: hypothetical protein EU533_00055 [Candidatus Lokiarchaeota archaeon]